MAVVSSILLLLWGEAGASGDEMETPPPQTEGVEAETGHPKKIS